MLKAIVYLWWIQHQQDFAENAEMPFELVSVIGQSADRGGWCVDHRAGRSLTTAIMQSFTPLPAKPEGEVIEASGLNTLMDNLVSMGLILKEEDVMAPMMGITLRSTGESAKLRWKSQPTARILANGPAYPLNARQRTRRRNGKLSRRFGMWRGLAGAAALSQSNQG
jgi:hypothetical protein